MNAHSTGFLGKTNNKVFCLLSISHNEVTKLINYHNYVRQILMSVNEPQSTVDVHLIILLYIACPSFLKKLVAVIHNLTDTIESKHCLLGISDYSLITGYCCHKLISYSRIDI